MYEELALTAANLETKDIPIDGPTLSVIGSGGKKFPPATSCSSVVLDVGESSALPSSASWLVCCGVCYYNMTLEFTYVG